MSDPNGASAGVKVSVKRKVKVTKRPVSVQGMRPMGGRPPPPGGARTATPGGAPRTASQQALLAQAKAAAALRRNQSGSIPPPPTAKKSPPATPGTKPPLPGAKPALPGRKPSVAAMHPRTDPTSVPLPRPPPAATGMPLPTPPKPGATSPPAAATNMPLPTPPAAAVNMPLPKPPAAAVSMPLPKPPVATQMPLPTPPAKATAMPLPTPPGATQMPLPSPPSPNDPLSVPLPVPPKPGSQGSVATDAPLPIPPKPGGLALPEVTTPDLPQVKVRSQTRGTAPRPMAPPKPTAPPKPKPMLPAKPKVQEVMQRLTWPTDKTPFGMPDEPTYIIFDNNNIKACTLEKLVENVTNPKSPDPTLLKTFLLTYRSITTPLHLMELLKLRFLQPLPEGNDMSVQAFMNEHQRPMQLRVLQLLKSWVQSHWYDFEQDEELIKQFLEFVEETVKPVSPVGNSLANIVARNIERANTPPKQAMFTNPPPKPIIPTKTNPGLLDLHPQELARQLTLNEIAIFRKIRPNECLGLAWSKKDGDVKAPNVKNMIERFNLVSGWVASEIVKPGEQKARVEAITHFIQVANECKKLNNFNACMEILSGLEDASVHRLKNHFSELSKKTTSILNKLKDIMNSDQSFKNFRAHLKKCTSPSIPYLGMYLTDLTFIEENGDLVGDLHNIFKRRMVAQVIINIQQYQQSTYNLEEVPVIKKYLDQLSTIIMDKEACYQRSLLILPRGGRKAGTTTVPPVQGSPVQVKKASSPSLPTPGAASPAAVERADDYGEMEDVPGYKFNEKDSPKNLRLAKNASDPHGPPTIIAGKLEKLVERLTYPKYPDPQFLDMFLLMYRTFTTGKELMELLIMRFNMPKPKNPAMLDKFKRDKLMPVMLRVINVLKNWVDKYSEDFANDEELTKLFLDFTESSENTTLQRIGQTLRKNIEAGPQDSRKVSRHGKAPPPQFPLARTADPNNLTLLDIHPEEAARQLCLVDGEAMAALQPLELLDNVWKTNPKKAPTVYHVLNRLSGVRNWVINEIIKEHDMEQRKNLLEHFIDVGTACGNLKNFHSMCGIAAALQSSEVKGLLQTWDSIGPKYIEKAEALSAQAASAEDLKQFRDKIAKAGSRFADPCVPYLRSMLAELATIDDAETDVVEGELINVEKRKHLSQVITDLMMYRNEPYNFEVLPFLHDLLLVELDKPPDIAREAAYLQESVNRMDRTKLKEMMRQELKDPELTGELSGAIRSVLQEQFENDPEVKELQRELEEYKDSVRKTLTTVHKSFVINSPASAAAASKKLLAERFSGKAVKAWSCKDSEGLVYGWPQTVQLSVVEGEPWVVYERPAFDKAELASLLRLRSLYERSASAEGVRVLAITGFVGEAARTCAEGEGIEVAVVG